MVRVGVGGIGLLALSKCVSTGVGGRGTSKALWKIAADCGSSTSTGRHGSEPRGEACVFFLVGIGGAGGFPNLVRTDVSCGPLPGDGLRGEEALEGGVKRAGGGGGGARRGRRLMKGGRGAFRSLSDRG